jgi:hypothetical protein
MKTQKGRPEKYDPPSRQSVRWGEMASIGKTCEASVKCPLDGHRSYTRACRTSGHTLPMMRTSKESTHRRAVGVVGEMGCWGQRGGAWAVKTRAKVSWAQGDYGSQRNRMLLGRSDDEPSADGRGKGARWQAKMEMRKGILPLRSSAFIAEGREGVGHGTTGPNEPTPMTWSGGNQAAQHLGKNWFFQLFKLAQNCKLQNPTFLCSKNIQTLEQIQVWIFFEF